MSAVRVVSRSGLVWNMAAYCILQFVFLHIIGEVHLGRSALNLVGLKNYALSMIPLLALGVVTLFSILQMKRFSQYLFLIYSTLIVLIGARTLFSGLDKVVLILLFAFIVLSYFMFIMWKIELQEASYRPGHSKRSLFRFLEYKIPVELKSGDRVVTGILSNWDDSSFYVHTNDTGKGRLTKVVEVKIQLNEDEFQTTAKVVAEGSQGLGFKVIEESSLASRDWKSFYDIIKSRGYINRFA